MAHGTAACRLGASMRDVFRSAEADTLVAAPLTADRAPRRRGASAPGWQPPVVFVTCIVHLLLFGAVFASCIGRRGPAARFNCGYSSRRFIFHVFRFYYARRDRPARGLLKYLVPC
jgi:hypothetical protein